MTFLNLFQKKFTIIFTAIIFSTFLNSCGIWAPADARKIPANADERVRKNLEEGKGFTLMGGDKGGTTYTFASSNPMWRASLEILDFLPLANACLAAKMNALFSDSIIPESFISTFSALSLAAIAIWRLLSLDFPLNCGASDL